MSKYNNRCHMVLLYPDNEEHVKAYQHIEKSYDYASILHDKDVTEDGELKKPHWHVLLRFKNSRWSTALCKELGIKENYIEEVKKFNNALQYLIHYNDPDKYQYKIEDVKGNLAIKLKDIINNIEKSEGEKVVELLEYITQRDKPMSVTELASYCAKNGYWSEFRRSGSIFCKILEEHNYRFIQNNRKD